MEDIVGEVLKKANPSIKALQKLQIDINNMPFIEVPIEQLELQRDQLLEVVARKKELQITLQQILFNLFT